MKKVLWLAAAVLIGAYLLPVMPAAAECEDIIIADFEKWPNNLGGEMGVYGSLEPDWTQKNTVPYSWIYELKTPGYDRKNVHSGRQSFRLVHGLGKNADMSWGSFGIDLGPVTDLSTDPVTVDSVDVSDYKYLTFWIKGKEGGENAEVLFRDAHSINYMPQAKYAIPVITDEWQKVVIPLDEIDNRVDTSALVHVGMAFGADVGNEPGDTIFVDDFKFTDHK